MGKRNETNIMAEPSIDEAKPKSVEPDSPGATYCCRPPASVDVAALPSVMRGGWWYVRHPWARITAALAIFVLDFLYYAEDPLAHSHVLTEIPIGGQAVVMWVAQWPSSVALCF